MMSTPEKGALSKKRIKIKTRRAVNEEPKNKSMKPGRTISLFMEFIAEIAS
tara:strand:- start:15054 stop:15206 length:153 start_codon:yes stop_codon:yes gene_type:complete